jgi:hypothetical protein
MSDELVEIIGRAITGEGRADIIGARAVLAALEAAGMVVVPKEPHADVLAAMSRSWNIENRHDMAHAYRAAIAASPKKG